MRIERGDDGDPRIASLLQTHFNDAPAAPLAESCHVVALGEIRAGQLDLWVAWDDQERLLGIGGLLELDSRHGEIKSIHTVEALRRRGTGTAMLRHLIDEATRRGYERVSLETGSSDAFTPARRLFDTHGFSECAPFADYSVDPESVYLTLRLR